MEGKRHGFLSHKGGKKKETKNIPFSVILKEKNHADKRSGWAIPLIVRGKGGMLC